MPPTIPAAYRLVYLPLFIVLAVVACNDDAGPQMAAFPQLAIQPVFQGSSMLALPVSSIGVKLLKSDSSTVVVDTVIAFQIGVGDTVDLTIELPQTTVGETLYLELELRDDQGAIVFNTGSVMVMVGATQPVPVQLQYVGVGSDAVSVRILAPNRGLHMGDTITYDAVALDSSGVVIAGTPVRWSTTDQSIARFLFPDTGSLTSSGQAGSVAVIAQLLTGPTDTGDVQVVTSISGLVTVAIQSLEDAMFSAANDLIDNASAQASALDLFTFEAARTMFEQAFTSEPNNETAAFGYAVTTVLALEDDPAVRDLVDRWDAWLDINTIDSLFASSLSTFPPTLAEHQTVLQNVVQPALVTASTALNAITSQNFTFIVTERMQGDLPNSVQQLELDLTEINGMRAAVEFGMAWIDVALAYQLTPSPWGASGLAAAGATGSSFGTLAASGTGLLADAQQRLLNAATAARNGLDFLELESDSQANDIVRLDPNNIFGSCTSLPCGLNSVNIQDGRDILTDIENMLQGSWTLDPLRGVGLKVVDGTLLTSLAVDFSQAFLNPISDFKTLLPGYDIVNGEFNWMSLAFEEWLFPDPSFNGVLPTIATNSALKAALNLEGMWEDGKHDIDPWLAYAQANASGDMFAISGIGNGAEVPNGFTAVNDRPDITGGSVFCSAPFSFSGCPTDLMLNNSTGELLLVTDDGQFFSRPPDATTQWTPLTVQVDFGGGFFFPINGATAMAQIPSTGNIYVVTQNGEHFRVPGTLSAAAPTTAVPLPSVFFGLTDLTLHLGSDLVALSQDGLIFSRPADLMTTWTQRMALPFNCFQLCSFWIGIIANPSGTSLLAMTTRGDLIELDQAISTVTDLPDVPAINVSVLTTNSQTGDLIALTEDGRIFSRPNDTTSPWSLQLTLPRTIVIVP